MRDAVASIKDYSCSTTGGVEGEDGLNGCVKRRDIECFEENLGSGVAICTGIERRFSQKDWVLQQYRSTIS